MKPLSIAIIALACIAAIQVRAEDPREMPSYMLMSDDFALRPAAAKDELFFAYDAKPVAAKLKELGLEFPKSINIAGGALFIVLITDRTSEAFASMSGIPADRLLMVDLKADKEAKPPKAKEGKKPSRVLLITCPPVKGIKGWEVRSADGKRAAITAAELK